MRKLRPQRYGRLILAGTCALLAVALALPIAAQRKKVTQTAGVNDTGVGAYRALAELSFQAFKKGDVATSAKLARVLEVTWDNAEAGACERRLAKTNRSAFDLIDRAMDVFIKPLINYDAKLPDPAQVQAAYSDYVQKLDQLE